MRFFHIFIDHVHALLYVTVWEFCDQLRTYVLGVVPWSGPPQYLLNSWSAVLVNEK
jgi:hypothetical protein